MLATRFDEFGCTGKRETSIFQALFDGKGRAPLRLAPMPRSGTSDCAVAVGTLVRTVRLTEKIVIKATLKTLRKGMIFEKLLMFEIRLEGEPQNGRLNF
jgi:hypothetical protein